MERLSGQRDGTSIYFFEGFTYWMDSRSDDILRCSKRRTLGNDCPATLFIDENDEIEVKGNHTHVPEPAVVELISLRNEIKHFARETMDRPSEIYNRACLRFPEGAVLLSAQAATSIIRRERIKIRPRVPDNMGDLGLMLEGYLPCREIFRGGVTAADGSHAVIFGSLQMVDRLNDAREIFVDGTFNVVPDVPRAMQLWTVHLRSMDRGFVALYVLCERRTAALYDAIMSRIIELAPGIVNVNAVFSDFETAVISTMRRKLPNASIRGCWFHFIRAVIRKWNRLGLNRAPNRLLILTWALPMLPPERFEEGLRVLSRIADQLAGEHPRVLNFMHYVRTQWLPLAEIVSVHGSAIRTNNVVESSNRYLPNKLGGIHPPLFVFLERLIETIRMEDIKWDRVNNGVERLPRQGRTWALQDQRRRDAQERLAAGRLEIEEFLRMIVHPRHEELILNAVEIPDENAAEEEFPDIALLRDPEGVVPPVYDAEPPARGRRRRAPRGARRQRPWDAPNRRVGERRPARIPVAADPEGNRNGDGREAPNAADDAELQPLADPAADEVRFPVYEIGAEIDIEGEAEAADVGAAVAFDGDQGDVDDENHDNVLDRNVGVDGGVPNRVPYEHDRREDEGRQDNCLVCRVSRRNVAFIPCGHFVCCNACVELNRISNPNNANTCVFCRTAFTGVLRIYYP